MNHKRIRGVLVVFLVTLIAVTVQGVAAHPSSPFTSPQPTPTTFVSPLPPPSGGQRPEVELSGPAIAAILALLLSLALEYVPGFSQWWDTFQAKRFALAGVGLLTAFVMVGLHYAGAVVLVGLSGPFIWDGLFAALTAWIAFVGAGQLAYSALYKALPRNTTKPSSS